MECWRCGLTVGMGCACPADGRPHPARTRRAAPRREHRPARTGDDGFRELREQFRAGQLAWSDLSADERAALSPEQQRRLRDYESDILDRPDQDRHGSRSVRTRTGGLPTLGRRHR